MFLYRRPGKTLVLHVIEAYSNMGDARQIVTGVAEKGAEMVICYWIQQRGSKQPKQLGSLAVG